MILTDADELREALRVALQERDEARAARDHFKEQLRERAEALLDARAEIERFRNAVREKERLELAAVQELDEARAEVERLRMEVNLLSEAGRIVAERQREACAKRIETIQGEWFEENAQWVRATPLVTNTKADGGAP